MTDNCQYENCKTLAEFIIDYSEGKQDESFQREPQRQVFSCQAHLKEHLVSLRSQSNVPTGLEYIPCRNSCRKMLLGLLRDIESQPVLGK